MNIDQRLCVSVVGKPVMRQRFDDASGEECQYILVHGSDACQISMQRKTLIVGEIGS